MRSWAWLSREIRGLVYMCIPGRHYFPDSKTGLGDRRPIGLSVFFP